MQFPSKIVAVFFFGSMSILYALSAADMVNNERRHCGMISLRKNKTLQKAAWNHARYLFHNRSYSHNERKGRKYYTGQTPFERMVVSGYGTRVGVENISFYEKDFRASVKKLYSTVYHRLAFLDMQTDEIGASSYGSSKRKVYVYDMGISTLANLCRRTSGKSGSGEYARNICRGTQKISRRNFYAALNAVRKRNPSIVTYPYPGQKDVPRNFVMERPNPPGAKKSSGFPVTVQLNPYRYRDTRLKQFRLYDSAGKKVKAKVFSRSSDPNRKIHPGTFVLIPYAKLRSSSVYTVEFTADSKSGKIKKKWKFKTAN